MDEADINWYDYGFRNYDPQIGRFPQLDPLTDDYPYYAPYQFAGNEPVANVDVDGLEPWNILQPVVVTGHATKAVAAASNLTQQALKLTGSFVLGVANAWASNQVLGAGRTDAVKNGLTDSYGVSFQIGQKVGDAWSMVTGTGEVTGGAAGEIASLGGATVVAVPVVAHGATAFWNGLYHLVGERIVYTSSYNSANTETPKNGETPSTKIGKDAHANYNPGSNYSTDRPTNRLDNNKIPDAVDGANKIVRELKPNNPRAIREGINQVKKYADQLKRQFGGKWRTAVDTYDINPDGTYTYHYGKP